MNRIDVTKFDILSQEPRGFSEKYWIRDNIPKLVKYNNEIYKDQDIMEKLSSEILKSLSLKCVSVNLGYNNSKPNGNCCIIDTFLEHEGDVSYEVDYRWIKSPTTGNVNNDIAFCFSKVFYYFSNLYNISNQEYQELKKDYIRMILGDCIIGNEDRKLKNVALIFNENNKKYRLAPSFDNALAFHCYGLVDTEPVCFVGNQYFNTNEVVNYIVENQYEVVEDVLNNLQFFVHSGFNDITDKYSKILDKQKVNYIIDHIKGINNIINKKSNRKKIAK